MTAEELREEFKKVEGMHSCNIPELCDMVMPYCADYAVWLEQKVISYKELAEAWREYAELLYKDISNLEKILMQESEYKRNPKIQEYRILMRTSISALEAEIKEGR
jgi:hypothetical protein